MNLRRIHLFVLAGIVLLFLFFKPVPSTQALAGTDVVLESGKSVGLYLWDVVVSYLKANMLWVNVIIGLLVVGFVFLRK